MLSRARLRQTSHAANSAIETPSGTHRDFVPRRKGPQIPFHESGQAPDSTGSPCPPLLPRACSLADLQPQSSANKEQRPTVYESKNFKEKTKWHASAHNYFKKRFMLSRSMIASQLYNVSIPRIPLIPAPPCASVKLGNAVTPNFDGGVLKSPILRSLICPALIFRAMPRVKCAETRVASIGMPTDLRKASWKIVINDPVSTSRRAG